MIGRTISHYTVLEELGTGGMGVVYRANDTRLKRAVALKFLAADAFDTEEDKRRFVREAQMGAALDHPNICTVHEINEDDGQIFIAMAYVDGPSLKDKIAAGPLELDEVLDIAIQAVAGLSAAHGKGIVHRDIKSSNILLNGGGRVVLTDFGLAKVVGDPDISGEAVAGSIAYMSPEQSRGDPVDLRTDIWSMGVVLYEMLTGRLPFRGEFDAALMYSILNEEPTRVSEVRPGVPSDLRRIINKMLTKKLADRFQTIDEVLEGLSGVRRLLAQGAPPARTAEKRKPSVAVLPFVDMSPDHDQEYFCDGMAEELTSALTRLEGLRVVARTSAFSFKGKNVAAPDIGRQLGVETLVEGSVRKAGERLRISVHLTNAADGYDLWAHRYDRELEDIFAIQDEIRLAIVDQLKVTLLGEDREALVKKHTVDAEAIRLYWQGRFFWNKRTEDGYRRALEHSQEAIEQDPSYALAYVGVADCWNLLGWYDHLAPQDAFPKARRAARKAMELDDTLAEAHATTGWICVNYDWSWSCAETGYKRALELNPGYATAHQWYGEYLSYRGRHEEALTHSRRSVELDPLSIIINADLGQVLYYARRYDEAIDQLRKTLEMAPKFAIAHFFIAFAFLGKKDYENAIDEARRALTLSGGEDPLIVALLATVYSSAGKVEKARDELERLEELAKRRYASPFHVALVHAGLGDLDAAFDWLKKARKAHDHWLETLKVHPVLDRLRDDPRYEKLLSDMKLAA